MGCMCGGIARSLVGEMDERALRMRAWEAFTEGLQEL